VVTKNTIKVMIMAMVIRIIVPRTSFLVREYWAFWGTGATWRKKRRKKRKKGEGYKKSFLEGASKILQ